MMRDRDRERLKDIFGGLAVGFLAVTISVIAIWGYGKVFPTPLKPFIALCNGQSFRIEAQRFNTGADGCVEFWSAERVAWICGCSAVGIAQEPAQSKEGAK